jgi:prephenate dehydratase
MHHHYHQVTREDGSESTVVGCVFGATPHIVSIDTFEFTFKPQGNYVLTFKNEDKPGAVLEVLKVLHNDSVNLASINVARDRTPDANTALTCISMDNNLSAKAMKAIQQLPGMTSVAKIQLN